MPSNFTSLDHTHYIREALKEANLALQTGEYTIGAVIVHTGIIIGQL